MNLYNNQGEINASSIRDLMQQLSKVASVLDSGGEPSNLGLTPSANSLSNEKMDQLIAEAMHTEQGKIAIAQAMANPIN